MTKKKKAAEEQPSFEALMQTLETIAGELESGELGLQTAIERYEQGVKCYRECHKILTEAEKKVEILTRNTQGELEARPFDEAAAGEDGSPDKDESGEEDEEEKSGDAEKEEEEKEEDEEGSLF